MMFASDIVFSGVNAAGGGCDGACQQRFGAERHGESSPERGEAGQDMPGVLHRYEPRERDL